MEPKKEKIKLGMAFCASFCTLRPVIALLPLLSEQYDITPIFSETMRTTDTRFGKAADLVREIETFCSYPAVTDIVSAEVIGPQASFDLMLIAPCTGNTLAKLAHGIVDNTITMAAKAHLRSGRPLVLATASNDALGAGLANFAVLANKKRVYFVPLRQDDPIRKPQSLVADFTRLPATLTDALAGRQSQPVLLAPGGFSS